MNKNRTWLIVIFIVAALIAVKYLFLSKDNTKNGGTNKSNAQSQVLVKYFVAQTSGIKTTVNSTGKIGAFNMVDIIPEVSGKLIGLYFKEGETVSKGTLLAKLNDSDLQAQLAKNKVNQKLNEQKLARLKKLVEIKGVSQEELEILENELLSLKADETFYLAQINKTNIVAPFTGVVGLKNVSEGAFVNATNPIVSMVQLNPIYVEFTMADKYANLIQNGNVISFFAESGDESYEAKIFAIEPKVDDLTKTIKIRALYSGTRKFYPGSFVNVVVELSSDENGIMVPTQCVIPILKGQKLYLVKSSRAVEQVVKIGKRTDQKIQIIDGLQKGDTIVATGLLSIKDGSSLKLIAPLK